MDWAAIDVKPDTVANKGETPNVAYLRALDILTENAEYDRQRIRYEEIRAEISK